MCFFRLVFFMTFFILPSLSADPIQIDSIEQVETHVRTLRSKGVKPEEIGVILDFHGVVTNEQVHKTPLTLKGKIIDFLTYLQEEEIPYCIATAWDDFPAVIQEGIATLELAKFFDVDPKQSEKEEIFTVGQKGSVTLKGHKNGKVVALKHHDSQIIYFRQKAFSLEVVYQNFFPNYILLVDDGPANLKAAQEDFPQTVYSDKTLTLFHLTTPKITSETLFSPLSSSEDNSSSDEDQVSQQDPRERFLQGYASPYITISNDHGKNASSSPRNKGNKD